MLGSLEPARCDTGLTVSPPPIFCTDNAQTDTTSFGAYIRVLRERSGMAIPRMAERVGLSASHYNRIELGEKAPLDATRWGALVDIGAKSSVLALLEQKYRATRKPRGRPKALVLRAAPGQPSSASWDTLPWEQDDWCWYAVTCHPGGLTLEQIGALMGCTPERVRKIEAQALAKLAVEPGAVEAMEVIEDRDHELAIWTLAADSE